MTLEIALKLESNTDSRGRPGHLFNMANLSKYQLARPCAASMAAIQELAERIADKLSFGPGDPLEPVVDALGGKISYQSFNDLDSTASGSILIEKNGSFRIFLPDYTSHLRDRFSIAHELGHYFLHFVMLDQKCAIRAERYGSTRVEHEANWFAAAFLMPEAEFKRTHTAFRGNILKIARKFAVSEAAARVREKVVFGN